MQQMPVTEKYYSGTSGLMLPLARSAYPPAFSGKSRLEYYSFLYNSVEINSSFYKIPRQQTVANWAALARPGFRFTFKVPRLISHAPDLAFDPRVIREFLEVIAAAGDKKGVLLLQLPPSVRSDRMEAFNELLAGFATGDQALHWPVAVEFRHPSWYQPQLYSSLEKQGAALVVHDLPAAVSPAIEQEVPLCYFRFHGPGGRYRGSYDPAFLARYAQQARQAMAAGKTVYAYFNNTMGEALQNLDSFNRLVMD